MGAWFYMEPRLRETLAALERQIPVGYVGRPERASPAEGSLERHALEQARIIQTALGGVSSAAAAAANGHASAEDLKTENNGAAKNGARTKAGRASTAGE